MARMARMALVGLAWWAAALLPAAAGEVVRIRTDGTVEARTDKAWAADYEKTVARHPLQRMQADTDINFQISYLDTIKGFRDPELGAQRRAVFEAVLVYVDAVLDHDGELEIRVEKSLDAGRGTTFLAAAGAFYEAGVNGFNPARSFQHIVTGVDPGGGFDMGMTVDFGYPFHLGELPVPAGQYDLFSVLLHEVTHGLGMLSLTRDEGGQSIFSPLRVYASYDNFLFTGSGLKIWTPDGFFSGNSATLLGGDGGVNFQGANTLAAYGGDPVPIYAPGAYEPGSSISHWHPGADPDSLMQPFLPTATPRREYLDFELGALDDLGYRISFDYLANRAGRGWSLYE